MKPVVKLSGTLLLNQFLADIACGMCVIPFPFLFGDNLFAYTLFIALDVFFFYYISYHGAYKSGFHDVARHSSSEYDKNYVKRGLAATLLAASPSILMFVLWYIGKSASVTALLALQFPLFLWSMFGAWPLIHILPNHMAACFLITIGMQIVFPLIGYFCGYRGIVFKDIFFKRIGMNRNR